MNPKENTMRFIALFAALMLAGCQSGQPVDWPTVCNTLTEGKATAEDFLPLLEPEQQVKLTQVIALVEPARAAACAKAEDPDAPVDPAALIDMALEAAMAYVLSLEDPAKQQRALLVILGIKTALRIAGAVKG